MSADDSMSFQCPSNHSRSKSGPRPFVNPRDFAMLLRFFLILALSAANLSLAHAAPEKSGAKPGDVSRMFTEWKQLVGKLYQLRSRYQKDPSADKKELETEYNELVKQALELSEPLSEAAEKAYLAAPNKDPEL